MEPRNDSFWTVCFGSSPRERWAATRFAVACLAWAVSFVAATGVLKRELVAAPASWAFVAVPTVLAIATLLVCVRYLRELDELQRRVQVGALAFACGVTWVAIAAYPLFELVGAPRAGSSSYMLVMVFSYTVGIIVAGVRYR